MIEKLEQFEKEAKIWDKAGRPVRTTERMLEIFDICSKCPNFEYGIVVCSCGVCGCRLHPTDKRLPNKVAWATTRCPLEEPKWEEDHTRDIEISESSMTDNKEVTNTKATIKNDCGCGKKRK